MIRNRVMHPGRTAIATGATVPVWMALSSLLVACADNSIGRIPEANTGDESGRRDDIEPVGPTLVTGTDGSETSPNDKDDAVRRNNDAGSPGSAVPGAEAPPCQSDAECDDGKWCNGAEFCRGGQCLPGDDRPDDYGPCPGFECDEEHKSCLNCEDRDGDGLWVPGCPEASPDRYDCDDADEYRGHSKDFVEVCMDGEASSSMTRDEDCNATTFGSLDVDGDGQVSHLCVNTSLAFKTEVRGSDCDDSDRFSFRGAQEVCDNRDNDCDGTVDEVAARDGEAHVYCLDSDADGFGVRREDHDGGDRSPDGKLYLLRTRCAVPPSGYSLLCEDCDDSRPSINPRREEICDGFDNDCEGTADKPTAEGALLFGEPFDGITQFECRSLDEPQPDGSTRGWFVAENGCPRERLDCDDDYANACEVIVGLDNCHGCGHSCKFSCGPSDCDEVADVAVAAEHICARTDGGTVACWGRNDDGYLGTGDTLGTPEPAPVIGLKDVRAIVAGDDHVCAITDNSTALCWGNNAVGQLGDSSFVDRTAPNAVVALSDIRHLSAAREHTCAVLEDGHVMCWGLGSQGRLGIGYETDESISTPVHVVDSTLARLTDGLALAAGRLHTCLRTRQDTVMCWGNNEAGQLGDPSVAQTSFGAVPVPGLAEVSAISAGDLHTCAIANGDVLCWGSNEWAQLGQPDYENRTQPTKVLGLPKMAQLALAGQHSCAVSETRELWCWGATEWGQAGMDPGLYDIPPTRILDDVDFVAAGEFNSCASRGGQLYCWGRNDHQQLGPGPMNDIEPAPSAVAPIRMGAR